MIMECQEEQLLLLRQLAANALGTAEVEEVMPQGQVTSEAELALLEEKLANIDFRKKMVSDLSVLIKYSF